MQTNSILVKNSRDPLFGYTENELIELLKRKLVGRIEKAFFFGSFGTRDFGPDSDIGLLIVKTTTTPFLDRALEFQDLLSIIPSMDILVYTPEEFSGLTTDPSPGFWQGVVSTLRRVI